MERRPTQYAYSTVLPTGRTVLPGVVCAHLAIRPEEILRYRLTDDGVRIDKALLGDDPFATFSEWASEADEKADNDL